MNRLRQPGDSDYDVLGLSPGATDEEIDFVFRQLIDGEGYRVGIPLNRQWLRAHQIKAAYAALRGPAEKRADRKTKRRAGQSLSAAKVDDPAKDGLVPKAKRGSTKPRKKAADSSLGVAANAGLTESGPNSMWGRAPAPRLEELIGMVSKAPPTPNAPPPLDDNERGPAPAPAPRLEELMGMVAKGPPPPDASPPLDDNEGGSPPALNDNERPSLKRWGVATAMGLGLGLVLLSSWPERDSQSFSIERAGAAAGKEGTAREAGELPPRNMAGAQSPAAMKPAGIETAAAKASSLPAKAAETRAIAPDRKPPISRASEAKKVEIGSRSRPVGTAPQWLGGGPTDSDNQQGRYQGRVALQVNVERNGRVSRCAPVRGSGNAELDALTCRLVRERARFTPARDSKGRPVAGQAYTTFVWVAGRQN